MRCIICQKYTGWIQQPMLSTNYSPIIFFTDNRNRKKIHHLNQNYPLARYANFVEQVKSIHGNWHANSESLAEKKVKPR